MFGNNPDALLKEENLLVPGQYLASYVASAHIGVIQQAGGKNLLKKWLVLIDHYS
jgi:hypothetical protein